MSNESSFILKPTKKSGNYSILRQCTRNGKSETMRIKYNIYGVYLPFGSEEYNENTIINAQIDDSTNLNHNLIITLNKICDAFKKLGETETGRNKYGLNDKIFFPFLKPKDEDKKEEKKEEKREIDGKEINKYQARFYLKYGAKINHAKLVGEMSPSQLKGKLCNLDIEMGSMWVNEKLSQYGVNVYVTHITVLN